jgi:hypothetical protein
MVSDFINHRLGIKGQLIWVGSINHARFCQSLLALPLLFKH